MNIALHAWKQFSYKVVLEDITEGFQRFYLKFIAISDRHSGAFNISLRDTRNAKRVLFVIAHPDDECRNYGMGSTRKKELYKSCKILGIEESNIFIHSHTHLPDAMDVRWPTELVSNLVSNHIDSLNITTLITFDRYGVSYHSNHSSIYYAVANLILDRKLPKGCGVYVLESVNLLRKYWSVLDIPLSFILSRFRYMGGYEDKKLLKEAMSVHESQLIWFRHLYMYFSRYTLINTLQQMNLVDIELDLEIDD
ncbi:hypothetical protein NQ314_021294 [Rhamnusium bicolor]|uniref:N-acetylglucosaminylphosphatidylinositol deacetylase n=1 Tax=Rhamnusium bicolor TaxID=1586634 RepID=A0AAV8WIQ3_9CUCU|nr:hypothetical protein NQ314_021294 [Rhamnusium bicolor]